MALLSSPLLTVTLTILCIVHAGDCSADTECTEYCIQGKCHGSAGNSLVIPCGEALPPYDYINVTLPGQHAVLLNNSAQHLSLILDRYHDNSIIVCILHDSSIGGYTYQLSVCYAPVDYIPDLWAARRVNIGNYLHEASLSCPIYSNPAPTCTWRITSCAIIFPDPPLPYYGVHYEDDGCTLVIESLTINYTHLCFECTATNMLGSITHGYNSFGLTSCNERLIQFIFFNGTLLPSNSTLTVHIGEDITLSCEAYGTNSFNTVFWLINFNVDDAIPPENTTFDQQQCKSTGILRLVNVTIEDSGYYTCGYGALDNPNSRVTFQLQVQAKDSNTTLKTTDQADEGVSQSVVLYITIPVMIILIALVILAVGSTVCVIAMLKRKARSNQTQSEEYTLLDNYEEVYDVFLSFAEEDAVFVETKVKIPLERLGYTVCWHHEHFLPGSSILDNIEQSVYSSRFTIAIISNSFTMSQFCLKELSVVSKKINETSRNCLIPIVMENSTKLDILDQFKVTYIHYDDKKLIAKVTLSLGKSMTHDDQ